MRIITIPRHNPVNAFTMGGIVRDAIRPTNAVRGAGPSRGRHVLDREADAARCRQLTGVRREE